MTLYLFATAAIILAVVLVVKLLEPLFIGKSEDQNSKIAENKLSACNDDDNTPLSAPCKITIKLNYTNEVAIQRGWQYGFSLNGEEPQYEKLGSVMTLTTGVERNALLGYGRKTMSGYRAANENPFVFTAVSGGEIKLKADIYSTSEGYVLAWKSNLSFDE